MFVLSRVTSSGGTTIQDIIFHEEDAHLSSRAAYLLLKDKLWKQDDSFREEHASLYEWLDFREEYLLEQQKENNGVLTCIYCGKPNLEIGGKRPEDLKKNNRNPNLATIDHKTPRSKDGNKYDKDNLAVSCVKCNKDKGDRNFEEYMAILQMRDIGINKLKYPRTQHVPWSLGYTKDDKVLKDMSHFEGKYVIITLKKDGENSTLMRDYNFARSLDSKDHLSRHWLKGVWGNIRHDIPDLWRICGENLFASHSILYEDLESYFLVFSIWNEKNYALSWNDTLDWCCLLDLKHVPVIWEGIYNEEEIKKIKLDLDKEEGYVIRLRDSFHYNDFSKSVAKFVRPGHVQTGEHWMNKKVVPNKLKNNF